jgi:hypothetical protein
MKNINIEKLSFDINLKESALKEVNDYQVDQDLVAQLVRFFNQHSREVFNKSLKVAIYKQEIKKLKNQLNHIKNET